VVGKSAMKLQNLLAVADVDLSEAIDNSIMAQIMAKGGDTSARTLVLEHCTGTLCGNQ